LPSSGRRGLADQTDHCFAIFKGGHYASSEPRRDFRRLHFLREWSYGKAKVDKIFTGSS
jgi:hypothetical protein